MARKGNGRGRGGGGANPHSPSSPSLTMARKGGGGGGGGGGSGGGSGGGNNGGEGGRRRGRGGGSGGSTDLSTELRGPVGNPPLRIDPEAQVMPPATIFRRMLRSLGRGLYFVFNTLPWILFGCIIGLFNFCFRKPYVSVNAWILSFRQSVRQFLYCVFHILLLLSIISLSASIYHGMQGSSEKPMPMPNHTNLSCFCNQTTSPTANFSFSGNTSFRDGFYWSVVTVTTVGFGDIVPQTDVAKLVTCLLVCVGLVVMTMVSQTVNEAWSEVEEHALDSLGNRCPHSLFVRWLTSAPPLGANWWNFRRITVRRLLATLYSLGCMAYGMVSFRLAGDTGLLDCFYATVTTESTVGYGDKSFAPLSESGKMAASFWILLATSAASRALELQVEARLLRRSLRLLRQELTPDEIRRIRSKEGRSKRLKEFLKIKYRNARLLSPEHESILDEQFLRCCPIV